jgi:hypothetical protein
MSKKSLKVCLKGVLRGIKGLFNKTVKIPQKSRKSQTCFLGFFDFLADLGVQKGGVL